MEQLKQITKEEFPILASVILEANSGDITKSASDIRKIDLMLTVLKQKSLLNNFGKKTRKGFPRKIKGLDVVLENIIERNDI